MKTDRGHKHLDITESYNKTMQEEKALKHPKYLINRESKTLDSCIMYRDVLEHRML